VSPQGGAGDKAWRPVGPYMAEGVSAQKVQEMPAAQLFLRRRGGPGTSEGTGS
jgi:hypothetical protein